MKDYSMPWGLGATRAAWGRGVGATRAEQKQQLKYLTASCQLMTIMLTRIDFRHLEYKPNYVLNQMQVCQSIHLQVWIPRVFIVLILTELNLVHALNHVELDADILLWLASCCSEQVEASETQYKNLICHVNCGYISTKRDSIFEPESWRKYLSTIQCWTQFYTSSWFWSTRDQMEQLWKQVFTFVLAWQS